MARRTNERIPIEASSGNVFADLGLPDAAELDTKVRLAVMINRLVAAHVGGDVNPRKFGVERRIRRERDQDRRRGERRRGLG